jgi:hypothetical protein
MDPATIKANVLKLQAANATPADIETYVQGATQGSSASPASQANSYGPVPTPFAATGTESPLGIAGKVTGNLLPSAANFVAGAAEAPFKGLSDLTQIPGQAAALVKESGGILPALGAFAKEVPGAAYNALVPEAARKTIAGDFQGAAKSVEENPVGNIAPFLMLGRTVAGRISPEAGAAFDTAISKTAAPVTASGDALASFAGKVKGFAGGVTRYGVGQLTGLDPSTIQEVIKNPSTFNAENIAATTRTGVAQIIKDAIDKREADLSETGKSYAPIRSATVEATPESIPTPQDIQIVQDQSTARINGMIDKANEHTQNGLYSKSAATLRIAIATAKSDGVPLDINRIDSKTFSNYMSSPEGKLEPLDLSLANPVKSPNPIPAFSGPKTVPATVQVDPDWFDSTIEKTTGLTLKGGKWEATTESSVRAPADIARLQKVYDLYKPAFDNGKLTNNGFLNLRSDLADLAKFDQQSGKSSALENLSGIVRGKLNTEYRGQIPGLENLDTSFRGQSADLKTLSKGLLDNEGNLRDSDINKIANATGKSKAILLQNLEQLSPGITDRINALKAVEDITGDRGAAGHKVGTYARAGGSVGAGLIGIATGNMPLLVGAITEAILTSPAVAIPVLRAYGFSKELTAGVTANLSAIAGKVNDTPTSIKSPLSTFIPSSVGRLTGTK